MFEVLSKDRVELYSAHTLDEAMTFAKGYAEFVSIKGDTFELVGLFGADEIKQGILPDGTEYTWKKRRK
jgi:hypothetical protein